MTKTPIKNILTQYGLRKTKPRLALGLLVLEQHPTHWTAESLFEHSKERGYNFSLATIYNTLNQFVDKGLLKRIYLQGNRCYYDTNLEPHHHVYHTISHVLEDIPTESICIDKNISLTLNTPVNKVNNSLKDTPSTIVPQHDIIVYAHD